MTRANLYYSDMDTPLGSITLVCTKNGLCKLYYNREESEGCVQRALARWSRKHFLAHQMQRDDIALEDYKLQLDQYFHKERTTFDCPVDLVGTKFQKLVWKALAEIPYGQVQSYKEVAQTIGSPRSVRAVGNANNRNHLPIIIPCHRVVGSNGALVGYAGGVGIKKQLLELEGVSMD